MSDRFTPEYEAMVRATVNPLYVNQRGTESYERATLLAVIDDLRRELAEVRASTIEGCAKVCEADEDRKVSGAHFAAAIRQLQRQEGEKEGARDV